LLVSRPIPGWRAALLAEVLDVLDVSKIAEALRRVARNADAPFNNRAVATYCLFRANLDARFASDQLADLAELLAIGAALANRVASVGTVLAQLLSLPAVDAVDVARRLAGAARRYALPGALVWSRALTDARFQSVHEAILAHLHRDGAAEALVAQGLRAGALRPDLAEAWRLRPVEGLPVDDGTAVVFVSDICASCHGYVLEAFLPDGDGGWAYVRGHLGIGRLDHAYLEVGLSNAEFDERVEKIWETSFAIRVSWSSLACTAKDLVATDEAGARMVGVIRAVSPGARGVGATLEAVGWEPDQPGMEEIRRLFSRLVEVDWALIESFLTTLHGNPAAVAAQIRSLIQELSQRGARWRMRAKPGWAEAFWHFGPAVRRAESLGVMPDAQDLLDRIVFHDLQMTLLWLARDPEGLTGVDEVFHEQCETYAQTLARRGWTLNDLLEGTAAPVVAVSWLGQVLGLDPGDPVCPAAVG
jgi:hypothetical protein